MSIIKIDYNDNFAIRIKERAVFEYCNHYLIKFELANCSYIDHPEIYFVEITKNNVSDCIGMGFSVERMKKYLLEQNLYMKGYIYYSKNGNKPVGCVWVAFKGADEFQYRIRYVDAFGFDFAVNPSYRGQGIVGFMIHELLILLKEKGINSLYASVRKNNKSALRAYNKFGATIVSNKKFYRVLGIRIPYPII